MSFKLFNPGCECCGAGSGSGSSGSSGQSSGSTNNSGSSGGTLNQSGSEGSSGGTLNQTGLEGSGGASSGSSGSSGASSGSSGSSAGSSGSSGSSGSGSTSTSSGSSQSSSGSSGSSGSLGGVSQCGCDNIPTTLYMTFNSVLCASIDGVVLELVWDGTKWFRANSGNGFNNMSAQFLCSGGNWSFSCLGTCSDGINLVNISASGTPSATCSPFSVQWINQTISSGGATCCNGDNDLTVTVTS